ncbi:MAG: recombinase RecT [Dysgonamonadaceae bacterium]|jgi:recombination protein RecT|nr:recombinase RecT [Dysgonamonadaceae bacterium]
METKEQQATSGKQTHASGQPKTEPATIQTTEPAVTQAAAPITPPAKDPAATPAKATEPVAPPALPKRLLDCGMQSILIQPRRAFIAAGGTERQFSREVNFAVQNLMNSDYLLDCAKKFPDHFVEAIKNVALTDLTLNPELKLAYLVPYKGKVKFQSSYMGKIEILTRAGVVRQIEANLVYESDTFKVCKGTSAEIVHEPNYFAANRGKMMGGYYVAILPNGEKKFDVMPEARINEIRSRSEAAKSGNGSPWDTDFEEMAKKTILNWAFKGLPKTGISDSMLKVIEVDSQLDNEEFEDWKRDRQIKRDRFDEEVQYAETVK